jgi:hypothetical protein
MSPRRQQIPTQRVLYHFTYPFRLDAIKRLGLDLTESNCHPTIGHYGPDVVWLTDQPEVGSGAAMGLAGTTIGQSKTDGRVTVRTRRAIPWREFDRAHPMQDARWRSAMLTGMDVGSWWVSLSPIPPREIADTCIMARRF